MEHEYKRDERLIGERLVLSSGGSSARLVTEDEIDQIAKLLLGQVCKRLEERGIAQVAFDACDAAVQAVQRSGAPCQVAGRALDFHIGDVQRRLTGQKQQP